MPVSSITENKNAFHGIFSIIHRKIGKIIGFSLSGYTRIHEFMR